jgi:type IX secretion system PorP/SprF family membrane protein
MKKNILCFMFMAMLQNVGAQQIKLTNILNSPTNLNPAYTGLSVQQLRASASYHSIWSNVTEAPTVAYGVYFDKSVVNKKKSTNYFGIGLFGLKESTSERILNFNTVGIALAFHHSMGKNKAKPSSFSLAVQPYLIHKKLHLNRLAAVPPNGPPLYYPWDAMNSETLAYADLNIGALWTGHIKNKTTYQFGASLKNISRPKENYVSSALTRHLLYNFHASTTFAPNRKMRFTAFSMYQTKWINEELILGLNSAIKITNKTNLGIGASYRVKEAFCPTFFVEHGAQQLNISYDIITSPLAPAVRSLGAIEISYMYKK